MLLLSVPGQEGTRNVVVLARQEELFNVLHAHLKGGLPEGWSLQVEAEVCCLHEAC